MSVHQPENIDNFIPNTQDTRRRLFQKGFAVSNVMRAGDRSIITPEKDIPELINDLDDPTTPPDSAVRRWCPPTPTRPKSMARSPYSASKGRSILQERSLNENSLTPSLSMPMPIIQEEYEISSKNMKIPFSIHLPNSDNYCEEVPLVGRNLNPATDSPQKNSQPTPLRVLRYKTNINPFSPSRGYPSTGKREVFIPTEKATVPRYVSDFEQHAELGKGSFGTVVQCLNRTDGWTYAIKKLTYKTEKMREKFLREAYALAALGQHPNIIRYYGSWEDKSLNSLYLQCEWCKGGSLKKQVMEHGAILTQEELCRVIRHVCRALQYMHPQGFAHGDVKTENILVDTPTIEPSTNYKLSDLGQINDSGDGKYLAPEVLCYEDDDTKMDSEHLAKADIFSLGITIFELAYERAMGKPLPDQRSQIKPDDITLPKDMYHPNFVLLLQHMLQPDPNNRPTANVITECPLVRHDLEWQLTQEREKTQALQNRIEALEQELIKTRLPPTRTTTLSLRHKSKSAFDLSTPPRFPIPDGPPTRCLSYGSTGCPTTQRLSYGATGLPTTSAAAAAGGGVAVVDTAGNFTHHCRSAFVVPNVATSAAAGGTVSTTTTTTTTTTTLITRRGFLSSPGPMFSPGLSFSFTPPTNP